MRIAILCIGSRGDVEPYLALGAGLHGAGHNVVLATHAEYENSVRSAGLDFSSMAGDPRRGIAEMLEASSASGKFRTLAFARRMGRIGNRLMVQLTRDGLMACRGADLIVASPMGIGLGANLAEYLDLPLIRAFYAPATPTREYPLFHLPNILNRFGRVNLWTYDLARQIIWLSTRQSNNRARREVLGLPPLSLRDRFGAMDHHQWPLLYCYSEAVIPRPADWGNWIQVTGYWFPTEPAGWSPPDDLLAFLAAGSPPVFIGFGSMVHPSIRKTADRLIQAALDAGERVIVSAGWDGNMTGHDSTEVMAVGEVPYSWLFPRMAAVIHHGGSGTVAYGLRAGVPTLVVPLLPDQIYWGRRVYELGAGCRPLLPSTVDQTNLPGVIEYLVKSPQIRQRAEELGRRIRSEDGVGQAVSLIEDYSELQGSRPPERESTQQKRGGYGE